jgi:hypothetical protein
MKMMRIVFLSTWSLAVATWSPNTFVVASAKKQDDNVVPKTLMRHRSRRHALEEVEAATALLGSLFVEDSVVQNKPRTLGKKSKSSKCDSGDEWDRLLLLCDLSLSMSIPSPPQPPSTPTSGSLPTPTAVVPTPVSVPTAPLTPIALSPTMTTITGAPVVPAPTTPLETVAPTTAPFKECKSMDRLQELVAAVQTVTPDVLNSPDSPQGFALNWLYNQDGADIDPCSYPTVQQRYALATVYAATVGTQWTANIGWLSQSPECEWFGVLCNEAGLVTRLELSTLYFFVLMLLVCTYMANHKTCVIVFDILDTPSSHFFSAVVLQVKTIWREAFRMKFVP